MTVIVRTGVPPRRVGRAFIRWFFYLLALVYFYLALEQFGGWMTWWAAEPIGQGSVAAAFLGLACLAFDFAKQWGGER